MNSKVAIFNQVLELLNKQADNNRMLIEQLSKLIDNPEEDINKLVDIGDPAEHSELIGLTVNISTSIGRGEAGKIDLMNLDDFKDNISDLKVYPKTAIIEAIPPSPPPPSFPLIEETSYDTSHIGSSNYQSLAEGEDIAFVDISNDKYIELKIEPTETTVIRIYKYKFKVKFNSTGRWSAYAGQWGDKIAYLVVNII